MIQRVPKAGTLTGQRLLVVTADFPNRIQPWMLNTTVQAIRHGAEVFIAAGGKRGHTYQAAVDQHSLKERTIYVRAVETTGMLDAFRYAFGPSRELRRAARRGLARAVLRPERFDPYSIGKGFALAVPLGLARISLIHSHAMTLGYEFLRVARVHRAPLVQTFHGLPPSGVPGLSAEKQDRLFRGVSRFLVNTDFAKGQLIDLGCPVDKVEILPQGTDLSEFPFEPRHHPGTEPICFLTVGRLHEDKGHAYALRALAALATGGMKFRYDIVGYGPEKSSLESLSRELGIADRVRFMDEVDDDELRREYREAHIFLFPSLRDLRGKHEETQGVALQEAQATGCLVVATRTGGIPESVDETHARLVPDRNPQALASGILDLVRQPERWPEWQTAGRRWVESRYSIDVIGSRLAELYSRVLSMAAAGLRA